MTEFEKMVELLDAAWLLRKEIVPCLVGPPGIGKTAAVEQHAKAHGCGKVVKIVASRCIPSETVGMTMPNHARRSMDIYNSMQLSSLEDGDILFLDELLEADQFVLSTLLTVIESREMADGTPLPDIQIIAATNDTIPPEQLKGNIRQRFMFERFSVDKDQTEKYIFEKTGMHLGRDILDKLTDTGNDYNFLTPRSLTKLCLWIDAAKSEKEMRHTALVINDIWKSQIGSMILSARHTRDSKNVTPQDQVKNAIEAMTDIGMLPDNVYFEMYGNNSTFKECTMEELLETLKAQPNWEQIAKFLASQEIKEPERKELDDIQF